MKTAYRYFRNILAGMLCLSIIMVGGCALFGIDTQSEQGTEGENEANVNPNSAASIDAPLVSANDSLLAMMRYMQFVSNLDKGQLGDEFKRINDSYFARPNDRLALKRAMLLMQRGTDFYDRVQAQQLLYDIVNKEDSNTPVFKDFAKMLLLIIEMQGSHDQQYTDLEKELQQEVQKRKKTEEQLEALKSIEESISQRK